MIRPTVIRAGAVVAVVALTLAGHGPAAAADEQVSDVSMTNPWLDQRFLNIAHSGGELEAPANTMYAFERAVDLGVDMLEMDVHRTADDRLVVIHDDTVDRTTNGTGAVRDMRLNDLRTLDAAYNFVPGRGAVPGLLPESYPLRGMRDQDKKPPKRNQPKDFAIPTMREVLQQFPDVSMTVEIKGDLRTAELLAELLTKSGRTDVIVASFDDAIIAAFHEMAPQIPVSPGMQELVSYFLTGQRPIDGTVAVQIPVTYAGIPVATPEFIARAHADGYAVHVWFSGTAPEDAATYNSLIDACADGLMVALPTLLEDIIDERGLARPGTPGADACQ